MTQQPSLRGAAVSGGSGILSSAVMSSLAAGVVIQDTTGTIVACNAAAERLLGLSADAITSRTSTDPRWRTVREDGSAFPGSEHPASIVLDSGIPARDVVMGVHRPNGQLVWILINSEPLTDNGALTGAITSFTDVTEIREASLRLAAAQRTLQATLDAQQYPHVLLRPVRKGAIIVDFEYMAVNRAAARTLSSTPAELLGASLLRLSPGLADDGWVTRLATVLDGEHALQLDEIAFPHATSDPHRRYDIRATAADDVVSLTFADVTDRYDRERALARSEELLRGALNSAATGIALVTLDGHFSFVNEVLCRMLECSPGTLVQRNVTDLLEPDLRAKVLRVQVDDQPSNGIVEGEMRRPNGSHLWTQIGYSLIRDPDGRPEAYLVQVENVTSERQARQELAYRTFHDTLTGLRNRTWIQEVLEMELSSASATERIGLLLIDVDHFKLVNDSLGHAAGDEFLLAMAQRLTAVVRPGDHFGRVGGDEFVVILTDVTGPEDLNTMASAVSAVLSEEIELRGQRIWPTVSIGISRSHVSSTSAALFAEADAALFRAKDSGRARWQVSDNALRGRAAARLTMQSQLRQALMNGDVVPHFQPIVCLTSGQPVGFEVLARWNHPERGVLSAAEFIEEAEGSDLILHIGHAILTSVCRVLRTRSDVAGRFSVNISAVQLAAPDWAMQFQDVLWAHGVDPCRLIVEVTETAALSLPDSAQEHLEHVRGLGVGVHVDDFGTGFSSIALLRQLPVTGLKLDASFVRDLTVDDSPANALAAGLAGLAKGLGLEATAEGIETRGQALTLQRQGWTHGQGWLYGKPAAAESLGRSAARQ